MEEKKKITNKEFRDMLIKYFDSKKFPGYSGIDLGLEYDIKGWGVDDIAFWMSPPPFPHDDGFLALEEYVYNQLKDKKLKYIDKNGEEKYVIISSGESLIQFFRNIGITESPKYLELLNELRQAVTPSRKDYINVLYNEDRSGNDLFTEENLTIIIDKIIGKEKRYFGVVSKYFVDCIGKKFPLYDQHFIENLYRFDYDDKLVDFFGNAGVSVMTDFYNDTNSVKKEIFNDLSEMAKEYEVIDYPEDFMAMTIDDLPKLFISEDDSESIFFDSKVLGNVLCEYYLSVDSRLPINFFGDLVDSRKMAHEIYDVCSQYKGYDLEEVLKAKYGYDANDNVSLGDGPNPNTEREDFIFLSTMIHNYPNMINKNGKPYTIEDVVNYVDRVSEYGFDGASTVVSESDKKKR